jgi:hypothetical protein
MPDDPLNLTAEYEHIRDTLLATLRTRLPTADVRPGSMLRTIAEANAIALTEQQQLLNHQTAEQLISQAISTPEGRSRLSQAMVAPLMARRRMQSLARELIPDPLPPGALPIYMRDDERPFTNTPPRWPDWAVENATVYYRELDYRPFRVTAVTKDSLKLSEIRPLDEQLRMHVIYSQADGLDREWASVLPPTAWQRLMEDE